MTDSIVMMSYRNILLNFYNLNKNYGFADYHIYRHCHLRRG